MQVYIRQISECIFAKHCFILISIVLCLVIFDYLIGRLLLKNLLAYMPTQLEVKLMTLFIKWPPSINNARDELKKIELIKKLN